MDLFILLEAQNQSNAQSKKTFFLIVSEYSIDENMVYLVFIIQLV